MKKYKVSLHNIILAKNEDEAIKCFLDSLCYWHDTKTKLERNHLLKEKIITIKRGDKLDKR